MFSKTNSKVLSHNKKHKGGICMRVLIIEDDGFWLYIFAEMVKEAGHEPVLPGQTQSPKQALEFIRAHAVDRILLDMNYGKETRMDQSDDGCLVTAALDEQMRDKIICASGTPEVYIDFLRSLGVRHFGGKKNFLLCLNSTCKC